MHRYWCQANAAQIEAETPEDAAKQYREKVGSEEVGISFELAQAADTAEYNRAIAHYLRSVASRSPTEVRQTLNNLARQIERGEVEAIATAQKSAYFLR